MAAGTHVAEVVKGLAAKHNGLLISILEDLQDADGFLSEEALREVARQLKIPLRDVYGVATFYHAFTLLNPRGKHCVTVCLGTACHVHGGSRLIDEVSRKLGIAPGETTKDRKFSLETVNCLGACALGPIVVVDKKTHGHMSPMKLEFILKRCESP